MTVVGGVRAPPPLHISESGMEGGHVEIGVLSHFEKHCPGVGFQMSLALVLFLPHFRGKKSVW